MSLDALAFETFKHVRNIWWIPGKDAYPRDFYSSNAYYIATYADQRQVAIDKWWSGHLPYSKRIP